MGKKTSCTDRTVPIGPHFELGGAHPNPRSGLVYEGIELGAKEEDIPEIAHRACYGNGRDGFVSGFRRLSREDVVNIYRRML